MDWHRVLWRIGVIAMIVAVMAVPLSETVTGAPVREVRVAQIYSIPNPERAGGFDRGHFLGGLILINKYRWRLAIAEDVPFPRLVEVGASYAEAGYDIVVYTSSGHIAAWNEVAPRFPRTRFVLASVINALPPGPNVAAYSPDVQAYGAMVGATAALLTRTGKVSLTSGMPILGVRIAFSAAIEAARAVRPGVEIMTGFSGDWGDLPKARELAALHIRRGADVLFTIHGPPTTGVLEAAEAGRVRAIGYAVDWGRESPSVATSVLMNHHRWYETLAEDFLAGRMDRRHVIFAKETYGLSDFRGRVSPEEEGRVRDTFARIQRGDLRIPFRMHDMP
jgi:basic membrane lipoprotein Med (substrate-binding protein (PBP1-ABC) superfamily)